VPFWHPCFRFRDYLVLKQGSWNQEFCEGAKAMVLEVLIGLLLVAGVGATILSFFVVRSSKARAKADPVANHDVDNPQRDIKQD
jgi:hypothetical protein